MKVTILRGISGAGKSTWIKKNAPNAFVVSADLFFMVDGEYKYDINKLEDAHRHTFKTFLEALADKKEWIIVDNTNVHAWEYSPYVLAAGAYGYDVELLTFECSADVALSRKQLVAEDKLRSIAEIFVRETERMPRKFKGINKTLPCA